MTDEQATADMRQGGHDGFATLHRRYEGRLQRYLISHYGLDKFLAEEICNDVFFRFYQTIQQFREEASVFTWLVRLARNKISEHWKGVKIRPKLVPLSSDDNSEEPNLYFEADIEKNLCYERCMRNAIAKLQHSSYADCINALIFSTQGLSIKEIAIKINRTPNATGVFMTACRRRLRKNSAIKRCWEDC